MLIQTAIIKIHASRVAASALKACVEAIQSGGVVVLPTDTVYGLASNAFHPEGVRKIYDLKGRSYNKPLPVFLADASQLRLVARDILPETQTLIAAYWPGPLTLVFKTAPMALGATRGKATIAVRIPDHGMVRDLLDEVQVPLAVTSANKSGKRACVKGEEAVDLFKGRVDLIVNGGICAGGRESTVVDVAHYPFTVLREGAISRAELTKRLKLG